MTTIKQVALEAGVSKSTVSRFIAQNGYVSDEAREKIERAIKKLNFRPNLSAQSLKTKKEPACWTIIARHLQSFFPNASQRSRGIFKRKRLSCDARKYW